MKENIQSEKLGEKFKKDLEEVSKKNKEHTDLQSQIHEHRIANIVN